MIEQKKERTNAPEVDFSQAREMARYLKEPEAMYVGAPGKHGYLRLGFELDKDGKSILRDLDRRHPLIVQQELYFDEGMPEMPCVYILSSGGPNVDGDRYRQDITVKKNAFAHVATGAATKLAEMRFNYSGLIQNIVLEEDAYLEFIPEPVIPCRNTRFISDTRLCVDKTATVVYSEIFMGGRKYYKDGELFEYDILSVCSHGERPDGEQLFREKFIIDPKIEHPRNPGVMGSFDVFANVIVMTPPEQADKIYEATSVFFDKGKGLAAGITYLPGKAGLLYKVLGMEPGPVKKMVRDFAGLVRLNVKGKPMPPEFPWR
ncbi:MAG: urease accessory protein UreD [Muribaculaceae bacterium]|nr:urease accessory protein UreD [Muribaculaceae bacterium]